MIPGRPDLLIVGGLTLDRLADGSTVAGGSVLHAARAAAGAGRRVATITAAGPEPEARAAVAELISLGPCLASATAASIRFAIHHEGGARRLLLEGKGSMVRALDSQLSDLAPRAVLLAPVAGEVPVATVRASKVIPTRVAALQGWLRRLVAGDEARPMPLSELGDELTAALADLDALVVSDDDLADMAGNPRRQLASLRAAVGPRPLLALTTGADGTWLIDRGPGIRHLPVPRRLEAISTVGAGDAFAGLFAIALADALNPEEAVAAAMEGAAAYLGTRR
jgi:sugar/nucleoside kinase (ribokinase family)